MENRPASLLHSIAERVCLRVWLFIARGLLRRQVRSANARLAMTGLRSCYIASAADGRWFRVMRTRHCERREGYARMREAILLRQGANDEAHEGTNVNGEQITGRAFNCLTSIWGL